MNVLLTVTPSLPDRNDEIVVNTSVEILFDEVPSLPIEDEVSDFSIVEESFDYFVKPGTTIQSFKEKLEEGETLIIIEYNPYIFHIDNDFWADGSNPDWNIPPEKNQQIWRKFDGRMFLTSTHSFFETYFDQPWSELCGENYYFTTFDHELGYSIPWFEEDDEEEEGE